MNDISEAHKQAIKKVLDDGLIGNENNELSLLLLLVTTSITPKEAAELRWEDVQMYEAYWAGERDGLYPAGSVQVTRDGEPTEVEIPPRVMMGIMNISPNPSSDEPDPSYGKVHIYSYEDGGSCVRDMLARVGRTIRTHKFCQKINDIWPV